MENRREKKERKSFRSCSHSCSVCACDESASLFSSGRALCMIYIGFRFRVQGLVFYFFLKFMAKRILDDDASFESVCHFTFTRTDVVKIKKEVERAPPVYVP